MLPSKAAGSLHASTRLLLCLTASNIAKQGMRRVDNSMHRKSRRLLKNIVILPVENPSHHADNAKKCGAQKIADTLRTRMLGKSPVCQNSGVGKKGEMLESCQHHQQRGKKQISNRRQKNPFQLMSFVRLPTRTREHQPERIACLGIESSGSRTHDLLLRRTKDCSPLRAFECPGMPYFTGFLTNVGVRISLEYTPQIPGCR